MGAYQNQDFSTLLDELMAKAESERPSATLSMPVDLLSVIGEHTLFGGDTLRDAESRYLQSAEREEIEDEAVAALDTIVVVEPPSIEPLSIDPDEIERELGLNAAGCDLDRARRDFAFANHPDRVDASIRDRAMVRMQIANQLVDDAKARARA